MSAPPFQDSVALTWPEFSVFEPDATWAPTGPATMREQATARSALSGRHRIRATLVLGLGLGLGRLGALLGPRLVELDAPLALIGLHESELRAERATAAALETRDGLRGPAGGDQLARHAGRELLARLGLPDDEPAARVVAAPARIALAVLHDVAPAHGARPEVGARDADVLELGVELAHGRPGELGDVGHELLARVLALLDRRQAVLPLTGQRG